MKKWIIILIMFFIVTGCSNQSQAKQVTLKVVYDSADEFMTKYGNVFRAKHPNIDFEVISLLPYYKVGLSEETYSNIIETESPDLIVGFDLEKYASEGKLINLDNYLNYAKDFKIDQINPYLLEYLRLKGGGQYLCIISYFCWEGTFL